MLLPLFFLLAAMATVALGATEMLALDTKAKSVARINRYQSLALQAAQTNLVTYLAQAEQQALQSGVPDAIPSAPADMGQIALCDDATPCGFTATATYAFDGTTEASLQQNGSGTTVTALNVERASRVTERRFGVSITVNVLDGNGAIVATRPQRKMVRLWAQAPYAEILGDQDGGARANRSNTGSADTGGCAPDGSGCDPSRVSAVDASTLKGQVPCNDTSSTDPEANNYGSGQCAPNATRSPSANTATAIPYENGQAAASNGP